MGRGIKDAVAKLVDVKRADISCIKFGTVSVGIQQMNALAIAETLFTITGNPQDNYVVAVVNGTVNAGAIPVDAVCQTANQLTVAFYNGKGSISSSITYELQWVRFIENQ